MAACGQCLQRFLGIVGRNPGVSKSTRLHACCDLSVFFCSLLETCSIDSSKIMGNFPKVLDFKTVHL